jgi:hypothetical protein
MWKLIGAPIMALLAGAVAPLAASAHSNNSCPRPAPGALVAAPPDLFQP